MKRDIWENKNILMLQHMIRYGGHIRLNPNGTIVAAHGSVLQFGKDYLLIQGDGPDLCRVYDQNDILIHQIKYHD
jgi:hypothetical protein